MGRTCIRSSGLFALAVLGLAALPLRAETVAPGASPAVIRDAALATEVEARLRTILPGEMIEVRTANAGLVLSGRVSSPLALEHALAVAGEVTPGRVSNLMTVGHAPGLHLTVRLAEMPQGVARNLAASLEMAEMFAPTEASGAGALPGFHPLGMDVPALIDALESKGALRILSSAEVVTGPGQPPGTSDCAAAIALPDGAGAAAAAGLALALVPGLDRDGSISVALRICREGAAEAGPDAAASASLRMHDGQTLALPLLPPGAPAGMREASETLVIVTARLAAPGAPSTSASPSRISTGSGTILITQAMDPAGGQPAALEVTEPFTLWQPTLR